MDPVCPSSDTAVKCNSCKVTFREHDILKVEVPAKEQEVPCMVHSTYRRDYPGHKRISPPLVRRPQDSLPIAVDYSAQQYITTCQDRFKPWDMKLIPRVENKAPRRAYTLPEIKMLGTTSYKDDFAKIAPLPEVSRMSRNKKKYMLNSVKLDPMQTGTTYKKDFGTWKVSAREIPPWAKRKERTTPPPFLAVTTQKRDYATPAFEFKDRATPYRPKNGYTFISQDIPMNMTTMYNCIHDAHQRTNEVYA